MEFRPDDNLGYWLVYSHLSVAHAFSEALKACCQEHQKLYVVTPPQWGVLVLLAEQDGMTIGTLSQRRGFDAPTITGLVKRLEQNGLLERRHDREDRRVVKVYLTDEARDIMRYLPGAAAAFHETMVRGFSEEEVLDLQAKLRQVIINVSADIPGRGNRFDFMITKESWFASDESGEM